MTNLPHASANAGLIWLASYPKSGNTWFRALFGAYSDAEGAVDINKLPKGHAADHKSFEREMGFDGNLMSDDEARIARRTLYLHRRRTMTKAETAKVHDANLPLGDGGLLFPADATAAVVHIVRHPFDVAVSAAFHFGWAPDFGRAVTAMCDIAHKIAGSRQHQFPQILSDWGTHTLSWLDMPGVRRITLRYEDMLADTADALGRALPVMFPEIALDQSKLRKAAEASGFDRLRAQETETSFRERPTKMTSFFRSGRAGGWRDHLTSDHCATLVEHLDPVMARLGYLADGSCLSRHDLPANFSIPAPVTDR
jgi:aryl sulfotransferase